MQDIKRNAMVGVFLRVLEYHNGVLFMTSNRVKFVSLFSLSFPPFLLVFFRLLFFTKILKLDVLMRHSTPE